MLLNFHSLGAEAAFDARNPDLADQVKERTGGMGVDTSILAVPNDRAFFQALDCTRKGGKILFFAEFPDEGEIPINPNILYGREIDLMGSYSSSYRVQGFATDIVFNKRIDVDKLVSDKYPLEELPAAVQKAVQPTPETYKILLYP
ncbi:zinc-binding dehydrogenase [Laspinema palackyanum]|uniref:zinc-binding dehydrogenase n=1 Tax=Laspinema palackyanum TaxID=3231601 RepID=UPI00345CFED0